MAFGSILCPVDFSTHSRAAVRHAVAIADRFGGQLTVLHVLDPLLLAAASGTSPLRRRFIERTRVELARFVTRSMAPLPPNETEIAIVLATGDPAEEILRAAGRLQSDLIVIGSQGLSGFRKLFFGSTTERVLRRAVIPVLAIPPATRTRHKGARPMAISRVVAPIDLGGEWQSDAVRAAAVAAAFDAELVLVHVLVPVQAPPWLPSTIAVTERRRRATARSALESVRAKLSSDLKMTARVPAGHPAHEIARVAAGSPSLVVMSLRRGAGTLGSRRGSIAYHVLTHSSTPVMAVPRRPLGGRV